MRKMYCILDIKFIQVINIQKVYVTLMEGYGFSSFLVCNSKKNKFIEKKNKISSVVKYHW